VIKDIDILVLDDEQIVCERLKDYMEKRDISVETFNDSRKAIERIKEKAFDVIVTDFKMEGPTGIDVLLAVKNSDYHSEVIIITGYGSFETYHEAEAIGAFCFVFKPFRMDEMYDLVMKAAKKSRKRSKKN